MARPSKAGGSTPERIVATAERMFAERGIEAVSLRDITNACQANSADEHGGRYYLGFVAAMLERPETAAIIDDVFGEQMNRYLDALERVLPDTPAEVRIMRFAFAKDFINRALAYPDRGVRMWVDSHAPATSVAITDHVVDFLVGAFRAPVSSI